jgi:hypothetical protein
MLAVTPERTRGDTTMWKRIAIGGAVAAAIVGVGTASLAETGSTTTPGSPAPATSGAPNASAGKALRHHPGLARALARRTVHGQFVTQNPKTKQFVTHDVIRGSVTSVSATSITVLAADKTSETFTVNAATKVWTRTPGQKGSGKKAAIADVKTGDQVIVLGTGASTFTATRIVDGVA